MQDHSITFLEFLGFVSIYTLQFAMVGTVVLLIIDLFKKKRGSRIVTDLALFIVFSEVNTLLEYAMISLVALVLNTTADLEEWSMYCMSFAGTTLALFEVLWIFWKCSK